MRADFICNVNPAEHLALPNEEDVRTGVMSARLAAHTGDMIKYGKRDQDLEMGHARKNLEWDRMYDLALDPAHARDVRASRMPEDKEACTMCGNYCALKIVKENLGL